MIKIGITGSIGMGKTTVARLLKEEGVPVFYADDAVHQLLGLDGAAVGSVKALFPEAVREGIVDRQHLGKIVFFDPIAMKKLEAVLHPLVHREEERFYRKNKSNRSGFVAFDIPLLFETGRHKWMDAVLVASAPRWLQRKRVLARPNMHEEKFRAIIDRQMPDVEKRLHADAIIHTGLGISVSRREVRAFLKRWRNK